MRKVDKRWDGNASEILFFYKKINDYTVVVWRAKDNFLAIHIHPYSYPCKILNWIKVDNIIKDIF